MTFTNKKSLVALLLTLCLIVSLFTVAVSAEDTTATTDGIVEVVSGEENTASVGQGTESPTAEDGTEAATEEDSKESTTEKKEEETNDAASELLAQQAAEARAQKTKVLIINAAIIAVIIIICVVVAIKFRVKLSAFFRSVKSELGKIVWSSKENTRKSFLVVIVVAVAIAIIIGILDLAFNTGIGMLSNLFK